MNHVIETLNGKLALNQLGEQTDWKRGFAAGILEAVDTINSQPGSFLEVGKEYYVIYNDKENNHLTNIERMKLYRINITKIRKSFCFISNSFPKFKLSLGERGISNRVFQTKEEAEKQ